MQTLFKIILSGAIMVTSAISLLAQPIPVPNFSFESQTAPPTYPFVNTSVDSWQKIPEPAYYGPAIGVPYGIPWEGTAGVFLDVNPYTNHVGTQAGYILAFPEVTLFQDNRFDLDATYEVGKGYNFTIGLFGKDSISPGSLLRLSLYYLDGSNNKFTVGFTDVIYSAVDFPMTPSLGLIDYAVNVPTVLVSDAWAGRPLGIQIESVFGGGGNWDFDNARLTVVPEPATMTLAALGLAGLIATRFRARH